MKTLVMVLLLISIAITSLSAASLPGQTLISDSTVQTDVTGSLFIAEKALAGSCKKSRIVDTKITRPPKTLGQEKGSGLAVAQRDGALDCGSVREESLLHPPLRHARFRWNCVQDRSAS